MTEEQLAALEWPIVALYRMTDGGARYWTARELGIKGTVPMVEAEFDRRVQAAVDALKALRGDGNG